MKERSSNIELLRIFAVYFVVVHHIILHYILHNFSSDYCSLWLESSISNRFVSSVLYSMGGVGVLLFFMITGYFLAEKTESGSIKKVFLAVVFYALLGAFLLFAKGLISNTGIDKMHFVKQLLFPVSSGIWWFPLSYIIIVVVAPILNKMTVSLSKKGFVIVLLFIATWWSFGANVIEAPFTRLQDALFYYLCGVFYKRFLKPENMRISIYFMVMLLFFTLLGGAYFLYFTFQFSGIRKESYLSYFFILVFLKPIVAFLLFSIFLKSKVQSKCINFIASTTFGVYLCHENWYGEYLFSHILFNFDKMFLSNLFPLYILCSGVVMFLICMGVDCIRRFCFEPCAIKIVNKISAIMVNNFSA